MSNKFLINNILLISTILVFLLGCGSKKTQWKTNNNEIIPIFNNQSFIASKNGKWGVINKKGEKILPFKYDGIKVISDSTAIATTYINSYTLNTGVPRYVYCGEYIHFTTTGEIISGKKEFSTIIVGYGDNHDKRFVSRSPNKFVPLDTLRNSSSCKKLEAKAVGNNGYK